MNEKIRFFEEMASNAHVALNVMQYDGWLLRFAYGHTNRANSVSVLYPSTIDIDKKITYCEEYYKKQNLPCVFKLADGDIELSDFLEKRGYEVVTPTDVMVLDLGDQLFHEGSCVLSQEPTEEWLSSYFLYEGLTDVSKQDIFRQMLSKVQVDTIYCAALQDGKIMACASAAIEQGYMLLQNVVVDPETRGRGFGKMVCQALISKAKENGVHYSYLQVVKSNKVAYRLAPENKYPSNIEDTNAVFTWVISHGEEYGFDLEHVFGVGDSAGAHNLGLYSGICTNSEYAAEYDFKVPEGFAPTAIALNCGAYVIELEGDLTDQLTKDLMADFLPEKGTAKELELINVTKHVTEKYPPTFFMTCTGDFLKDMAPLLAAKLAEKDVPFVYRYYGDSEHELGHVFHCNIKSEDARLCNDEECSFFKEFCQ